MDPIARDLLERAQNAHDPTAGDRARVRKKLASRIGAGVLLTGGTAKATGLGWALMAKIAVPVVAAFAVGGYFLTHHASHTTEIAAPVTTARVAAPETPTAMPESIAVATITEPTASALAQPIPSTHVKTAPPAATADLAAETLLLADAQSAIQRSDFGSALATLDRYEKTFPNGLLTEERIAARVVALCGADRKAEALALSKTFLARYPRSPLAPRVKSACATP
jgi:hypothetical protein